VIWFGSVRPDGSPHLVPIWFIWQMGRLYICTEPESVKSRNIRCNERVVLALEDGTNPVICEGVARPVASPFPDELLGAFFAKYEWDITKDEQYTYVIEITPVKWLSW